MLVYLKEPMGYTQIDNYRIYGRKYAYGSFGAVDLPAKLYKKHKNILENAKYTKEWLEEKFNKTFPKMSFTIDDLYRMEFSAMLKIARLVGIDYIWASKKKPTIKERHALRKSIIAFLNS
jgi:hypothetical protein